MYSDRVKCVREFNQSVDSNFLRSGNDVSNLGGSGVVVLLDNEEKVVVGQAMLKALVGVRWNDFWLWWKINSRRYKSMFPDPYDPDFLSDCTVPQAVMFVSRGYHIEDRLVVDEFLKDLKVLLDLNAVVLNYVDNKMK